MWQDAVDQLAADGALDRDEKASQTRMPRGSRLKRYEVELDAYFAELAAEQANLRTLPWGNARRAIPARAHD